MRHSHKSLNTRWTPIAKGSTYCSPACGRGCKLFEYNTAVLDANAARLRMKHPEDWIESIHENLGWWWSLNHKSGYLSVSGGQHGYGQDATKHFHAMLSSEAAGAGTCNSSWYDHKTFSDPNRAVQHRLLLAKRHLRGMVALLRTFEAIRV